LVLRRVSKSHKFIQGKIYIIGLRIIKRITLWPAYYVENWGESESSGFIRRFEGKETFTFIGSCDISGIYHHPIFKPERNRDRDRDHDYDYNENDYCCDDEDHTTR